MRVPSAEEVLFPARDFGVMDSNGEIDVTFRDDWLRLEQIERWFCLIFL